MWPWLSRSLAASFVAVFLCVPAQAAPVDTLAVSRGVNVSNWLANAARQPLFDRDFLQIKSAGFDHVRVPVNPAMFGFVLSPDSKGMDAADFTPVDNAIQMAINRGLVVMIDLHLPGSLVDKLEQNPDWAEQKFVDMWVAIAKRYKGYSSTSLTFELLNEPQYYNRESLFMNFAQKIVNGIRTVDKDRILIVNAPNGGGLNGLLKIKPLVDKNTIYSFHFYEPYIISHQGMMQGFPGRMYKYFKDLPYPTIAVKYGMSKYAANAPDQAEAKLEFDDYMNTVWNDTYLHNRIQKARDWSTKNRMRVICTEFGVLRGGTDNVSRYRWIKAARMAMNSRSIGWSIWDYTDMFGIVQLKGWTSTDPVDNSVRLVDEQNGSRIFEPEALTALGLR